MNTRRSLFYHLWRQRSILFLFRRLDTIVFNLLSLGSKNTLIHLYLLLILQLFNDLYFCLSANFKRNCFDKLKEYLFLRLHGLLLNLLPFLYVLAIILHPSQGLDNLKLILRSKKIGIFLMILGYGNTIWNAESSLL